MSNQKQDMDYRYGPFPVTRPRIAFVERDNVIRGAMTAAERALCSPSLAARRSCRIAELTSRGYTPKFGDKVYQRDLDWQEHTLACHTRISTGGALEVFRRMLASCYHRASALVYDEPARALTLYRWSEMYERDAEDEAARIKKGEQAQKPEQKPVGR